MTIKNGDKLAFPVEFSGFNQFPPEIHCGLSKREMFAMAAMQGILASLSDDCDITPKLLAECSVRDADALLAELERTK